MIDLPPINIIQVLQSNILQTMFAVTLAVIIGLSQKTMSRTVLYAIGAFGPAFYMLGNLQMLVQSQNIGMIVTFLFAIIGTWIVAKSNITSKK